MSSSVYLLDTNMVTYLLSGRSRAARLQFRDAQEHGRVTVSTVSQAEILFGLEAKPGGSRLRAAVLSFFESVEVLAWDASAAQAYARLRARLKAAGKSLSAMDLLIAAHASAIGAALVTHDGAFLHATPFLDVVDWATDL